MHWQTDDFAFDKNIFNDFVDLFAGSLISFFIKHEVYWIINNVRTRAKVSPDGCNGHLRPVRTKLGCAVTGELVVASTLPTVNSIVRFERDLSKTLLKLIPFQVRGTLLWHSKSLLGRTIFCIKVPIFVGE